MADPDEAAREDVEEKAREELGRREGHRLHPVPVRVVPPPEAHEALGQAHQAVVGEGDPMRVPAQVLQHLVGAPKGRLGVHHPVGGPERGEELAEGDRIGQARHAAGEAERPSVEGPPQPVQVLPTEDASQGPDRKEEARLCREPPGPIAGERPTGDHAVQMEVLDHKS